MNTHGKDKQECTKKKKMKENATTKRIPREVQNPTVGLFEECVYHIQERNP